MIGTLKLAALGAALSAGLVAGFDGPAREAGPAAAAGTKAFHGRLGDPEPAGPLRLSAASPTGTIRADRLDAGCGEGAPACYVRRLEDPAMRPFAIELRDEAAATSTLILNRRPVLTDRKSVV